MTDTDHEDATRAQRREAAGVSAVALESLAAAVAELHTVLGGLRALAEVGRIGVTPSQIRVAVDVGGVRAALSPEHLAFADVPELLAYVHAALVGDLRVAALAADEALGPVLAALQAADQADHDGVLAAAVPAT